MRRPPIGRLPGAGIDQSNFASPFVTLAPLLAATPTIQLHAFAAITAFALGLIQLAAPKGTFPHRLTGWV